MESSKQTASQKPTTAFLDKIERLFNTGIKMDLPFAIWRNPKEQIIHATLQLDQESDIPEEIEHAPTGFLVHPFQKTDAHQARFIKSDVLLDSELNEVLLSSRVQRQRR
ncbi:hypothetical protein N7E81_16395 [Reichenbachiella carrageenanivorans]|uniref:YjbR protein n=1 Tax=Reichenbachiella carrageenanivorans TaxID=2979869 RepID=A0ABY6CYE6_9BACT|nr:hypothetical protein [Reichenbachiella carrageenanivorans]UXX78936.1 hypothetical protein N7E81_16395 [Reichenbachiella carrageenanivorans]